MHVSLYVATHDVILILVLNVIDIRSIRLWCEFYRPLTKRRKCKINETPDKVERKLIYVYLSPLNQVCKHHNGGTVFLPDQSPEIIDSCRSWT